VQAPPGVEQIELPVPFPIGSVNAWYLSGRAPALVDCGLGSSRSYAALMDGLARCGAPLGPQLQLFITHGHVDHAGNAARLRRDHGIGLAAHPDEAPFVSTFRRDSASRNDEFADALRRHGMPAADVQRLRADSHAIDRFLEDTPIDRALRDGEEVALGDRTMQALHTPGHTPGSLCYLQEEQFLFTGDTLLEAITSNALELKEPDFGNYHQYVATLHALRRYVGVLALPGHYAPFRITDALLDRHIAHHEARAQAILVALADGAKTAWQVMRKAFPAWSSDPQMFMGMAEIVGHLHALQIEGRIRAQDDGTRRFVIA
jgi:glyoxylase-like metal-dependent hydrolase (beta-lactamase superfamily II)